MTGIVKYVTGWGGDKIEVVEVVRETKASVFLMKTGLRGATEKREAKCGDFAQYHDTWAEAHAHLVRKAEAEVKAARLQLEKASGKLANIKGMPIGKVSK